MRVEATNVKITEMICDIKFFTLLFAMFAANLAFAKTEALPAGVSSLVETSHLAQAFEAQKNQIIPEASQRNFKVDSTSSSNLILAGLKSQTPIHLFFVRGHFKAKWNNDGDNVEEDSVSQVYDAAFAVFDSQKKAVLLDEYFSEDGCDGDHIVGYSGKYLFYKTLKSQSFFSLERKMKGDFCAGEKIVRNWVDSTIYYLRDSSVRKLHSYVSYDKKESLAFFPDSEEPYISGITYLRSDLVIEKNEKKQALDFMIKSVSQQGIEKPIINKVVEHFSWNSKLKSFDESD